jgi:hypothetical protein
MYKLKHFQIPILLLFCTTVFAQKKGGTLDVGVAKIDITPYGPIRLSGYLREGARKQESEGALQQLWAKAIAIGSDAQHPSVIITLDLAGIQAYMRTEVGRRLSRQTRFDPTHLAICASHTHSGPDMGNSHNMYFNPKLPVDQLGRIAAYLDSLTPKLEKVALEALRNRKPSLVSWGQGSVGFALNRRVIKNGLWVGHGKVPDGPVDHSLPLLKVTDLNGAITALFTSYACHGTTIVDDINKTHGDWIGEAQQAMEEAHPGAIALVAQGCGGDSDPDERNTLEAARKHGQTITAEINRLLHTKLQPLTSPPVVQFKNIKLPYDHVPDVAEFVALSKESGAKGHNAEVHLERMVRGIPIDTAMTYPIQSFTFGKELTMLFLGGEVLADYALRLKRELGGKRLWINAYANDVKAYIPSKRVIAEGGYEVEGNMYYYDHPFRFSDRIEEIIIHAVYGIVPQHKKPSARKTAARQMTGSKRKQYMGIKKSLK